MDGRQVRISGSGEVHVFIPEHMSRGAQVRAAGNLGYIDLVHGHGGASPSVDTYSGVIEFRETTPGSGTVTAINVVDLEEYVRGVLPNEMPPSFNQEALMAQAVATRTFAVYRIRNQRNPQLGYDLCDTTASQVFTGAGRRYENVTRAVNDTRGYLILFNGNPINASFFASSGGATESSENVWFEARPYLRGVSDSAEVLPNNETHVWTRTFTWAELTTVAGARSNIGQVTGLSTNIAPNGRVQGLIFHGSNGNWTATREDIRTIFSNAGGALNSRNFQIAGVGQNAPSIFVTNGQQTINRQLSDLHATATMAAGGRIFGGEIFDGTNRRTLQSQSGIAQGGSGVTLNGRGWGHGVGMSQHGANSMAQQGSNWRTILNHYYTSVELRRM